jgi:hypothetical protein
LKTHLFWIQVVHITGHVLSETVHPHLLGNCCLHHFFQRPLGMCAELAAMAVMRIRHDDSNLSQLFQSSHRPGTSDPGTYKYTLTRRSQLRLQCRTEGVYGYGKKHAIYFISRYCDSYIGSWAVSYPLWWVLGYIAFEMELWSRPISGAQLPRG